MMKAGLMEIADVFIVNKCDRPESDKLVRELINMLQMHQGELEWQIPVVKTQAVFDQGIDELFSAINKYEEYMKKAGLVDSKRMTFLREELIEIAKDTADSAMRRLLETPRGQIALNDLFLRKKSPYQVARNLLKEK